MIKKEEKEKKEKRERGKDKESKRYRIWGGRRKEKKKWLKLYDLS